ncbi:hypothetical protein B1L11_27065 [Microbispora sp. GKU 823]|nr:hypothetical protein B1L11_27065 [Microbispora sp. GKU 823]
MADALTSVGKADPMLTVVPDPADGDQPVAESPASSSLIDEIVREGARRMLAAALQLEYRGGDPLAASSWRDCKNNGSVP